LEEKTLQLEEANQTLQRDIAERIRAEAKLREQATLLDKAQDAILVWDLEHRVRYWNRGAERLYGWTAGEVAGRSIAELVQGEAAWFAQATAATLERGEWQGEVEQTTRDARHLTVESRWTLVRDDAGVPRSMLVINTDITERKRLESQFLRAQRMESIGTLSAGIAHDLNNILAPILMSVEVLRSKLPAPADRDTIATLESCCRRGADLVKQVLSFARGIAGQRVEVDPSEVTKELVDVLRETLPRSIAIRFAPPRDLWRVVGDAVQLHQVLLNLCINARDAMPRGGELRVSLENRTIDQTSAALIPDGKAGRYVVLTVADQGVGIPHEVRDTIFEPFFTTKDFGKGTGLGLSTTMAIVRSHGGFIALHSEPGEGAEFSVYLPAASGTSEAEPTPRDPVGLRLGSGELILLVDDEAAIRDMAKMTLEHCGYRVMTAEDGEQALAIYRESGAGIAAVVTDLAMPGMDGLALGRALRAEDPAVKILGTSGLELEGGATAATDEGIDIFLMKPYSLDALLEGIRTLLTEDRAGPE
jgi:PAS domain S-box-containing protein